MLNDVLRLILFSEGIKPSGIFFQYFYLQSMKELPKILLSKKEIQLLREESFFRQKKIITGKIFDLLAESVQHIQSVKDFQKISFPPRTDSERGKITRGENYLGLPFLILDFPRLFSEQNFFAFRTMIWWGNHVSCTLVISGNEGKKAAARMIFNSSKLKKQGVYLCVSESPWQHHFGEDNFLLLKSLRKQEVIKIIKQQNFFKVARKIPVDAINNIPSFAAETFSIFAHYLL